MARHYGELDRFYREAWGLHLHHGLWERGDETPEAAAVTLARRVAAAAGVAPGARVVDVGCGYGATARLCAAELGAAVTGFTLSAEQARVAAEQAATLSPGVPAPLVHVGDWLSNDLADASADALLSIECLSHVADKARFLAEVRRVLAPGARAALAVWLAAEAPSAWQRRRLLEPICREGRLAGLPSERDVRELAAAAGLAPVRFEDWTPRVRRTWSVCARRVAWRVATRRAWRRYVLSASSAERAFALCVPRLWLAYRTGAMRYGLFVLEREGARRASRRCASARRRGLPE